MAAKKLDAPSSFPLGGGPVEGGATATCYCGGVQLIFPTSGDGLRKSFVCHCTDCRKVTASMFATNFIVREDRVRWVRGVSRAAATTTTTTSTTSSDSPSSSTVAGTIAHGAGGEEEEGEGEQQHLVRDFAKRDTIRSGNTMTSRFCGRCGTLMARRSSGRPGLLILRVGTVDDFGLHEGLLRPAVEQFVDHRVGWLGGGGRGNRDGEGEGEGDGGRSCLVEGARAFGAQGSEAFNLKL